MNQTKPDKWVINVLPFVFLALVWILTGCGRGQLINAVTPTATAISTTSLPQPTVTPREVEPTVTPLPATATPSPTTDQVTPAITPRGVSAPLQEANLGQPFILPLGHSVHLAEADLTMTFWSLLEDSRCPKQVNCFWAGQVRIIIQVQQGQAAATLIEMNTNPPLKQNIVSYADYDIELIGVDPYPESPDQTIPPEDYQTTFVVKKK